jgi:hypothetical protein
MLNRDQRFIQTFATWAFLVVAFSSPSFAASDEEIGHSGDKMSGAFRCLTYARMFHDYKEEERLLLIGLKAGRDFVVGLKNLSGKNLSDNGWYAAFIRETSTDFVVGITYNAETTKAYDEIVKYQNGVVQEPSKWLDPSAAKTEAERSYGNGNCSLIQ